jgi:hypothetical protein
MSNPASSTPNLKPQTLDPKPVPALLAVHVRMEVQKLHLTQSVFEDILQKSTPPKIRQLILYYYLYIE